MISGRRGVGERGGALGRGRGWECLRESKKRYGDRQLFSAPQCSALKMMNTRIQQFS